MRGSVITALATCVLCGTAGAGSIHKCTDAAGNVTFSQTACPAAASGGEVGYSAPSQQRSSGQASGQRRSPKQNRHTPKTAAVQSQPQASTQQAPGGYDPYSIENQVKRLETEKEKRDLKHRQYEFEKEMRLRRLKNERTIDEMNNHVSRRKQNKIDRAKCDYYKAKARKYEYKDDELHTYYNLQAAETCR